MITIETEIQNICDTMSYPCLYIPEKSTGLQMWIKPQEIEYLMLSHIQEHLLRACYASLGVKSVKKNKAISHYVITQGNKIYGTVKHDPSKIKVVETPFTGEPITLTSKKWLTEDTTNFLYNTKPFHVMYQDTGIYGVALFSDKFVEEFASFDHLYPYSNIQVFPVVEDGKLTGLTGLIKKGKSIYFKLYT